VNDARHDCFVLALDGSKDEEEEEEEEEDLQAETVEVAEPWCLVDDSQEA